MEEAEVGFILMWTHPEATQMAKVYVTKRSNVVVRLRNVKTTCGYEPQLFCQEEVLCANFLKRLLYTELQNCRRVESKCSGCNRIHYRWLEIKSEHVRALLNRWGKWMKLEPYGGRGELVSFWSSAILEAPKLETLEQFHGWLDETIELAERAEHERSMVQRPSADSTGKIPLSVV
jgi:hypothetical protein